MNVLKALWQQIREEPALFSEAVRQALLVGVVLGLVVLDQVQLAAIMSALSAILTFLTRKASTPTVSPTLPAGTMVTVETAPGTENFETTLPEG